MKKVISVNTSQPYRRLKPALTPEAQENQMIALAMDLVKQRLIDGTASSQETTHFLKLATSKEKLEREKLELEKELLVAKTKALQSNEEIKKLYANALNAMRNYSGQGGDEDDDEEIIY